MDEVTFKPRGASLRAAIRDLSRLSLYMTPCAPFLPMLSDIAKTDPAYTAAHILVAALGTIIIMPIGVPLVAPDLHAVAGVIARPLLVLVIAPFGVGIIVRWFSMKWADKFDSMLRKLVAVSIVVLLTVALL